MKMSLKDDQNLDTKELLYLKNERRLLSMTDHPFIVKMYD